MRERSSVAEAHEPVDDRRRLQHDLDPVVGNAEEEVRLDQLEPLVRERRRVDRDLRAHAPGGMGERLLGRHVDELVARPSAERPARARQDESRDLVGGRVPQALVQGRVLAVDRENAAAAPPLRGEREVAGCDEALLVRKREVDPVLERPERRVDAREPDDGVQDDVRLGPIEQIRQIASNLLVR